MRKNSNTSRGFSCSGHPNESKTLKPATAAGFRFMDIYHSQGIVMKFINYKPAKIVKAKHHWYVEYQYKGPDQKWHRFRVYEDINRFKSDEYNKLLLDAVNAYLEKGYSPYDKPEQPMKAVDDSLNKELDNYMAYNESRGLSKKSMQTYRSLINTLKNYFTKDNRIYLPVSAFTKDDIKGFFEHTRQMEGWSNMTYNKAVSQLGTFFLWLNREGKITHNPCSSIEKKKAIPRKHMYYDDATAQRLKDLMAKENPYLLSYCEFIYYTAIRPKTEGPQLQVKHILFERDLIEIPGEIDKANRNSYIPMAPELKEKLQHLRQLPGDYYIWGNGGPSPKRAAANYWSNMFKKIKDKLGLDENATIYSYKHTRAIHLAKAGMDPFALMRLFRHTDFGSTMKYLRDLGADIDFSKYDKTRKF